MGRFERAREAQARLDRELQEERAAALRRIAGRLEALLDGLADLRRAIATATGAARADLAGQYETVRTQARLYRWYLEVQREAIGLRRHEVLDRLYPVPPPLADPRAASSGSRAAGPSDEPAA